MQNTKGSWQTFELSKDQTHHLLNQHPAYSARFHSVLKFHEPGLAPAQDSSGSFHITPTGQSAYSNRYLRTFGFYEGRAAVQSSSGWHHILCDGSPLYPYKYAWCGNFQQGLCVVKDKDSAFFHINLEGNKIGPESYYYAGDFRDGYAVVQNSDGLYTHIDHCDHFLHEKWFLDLDVYHKGFARAKGAKGWFHIDLQGDPIYSERYKGIEPFYNGVSRVETEMGALHLISETGEIIDTLRSPLEDEFHQVSAELVSYWRFYTLQAAIEFQLFDYLPSTQEQLLQFVDLPPSSLHKLLRGLQEIGFVHIDEEEKWLCTAKGSYLQSEHPYSLKNAARLWNEEHLLSWSNMTYSLKNGASAFQHLFGKGWFDYLEDSPEKRGLYHAAISVYAQKDYQAFCSLVDLSMHRSVVDIGASTGSLIFNILNKNPHLIGFILDLPSVIQLVDIPNPLKERVTTLSTHFFQDWPPFQIESAILSRILHDWPDEEALKILKNVHSVFSTNPNNRLYIIEKIQDETNPHGALLDLNMLIMTAGMERTLSDFKILLEKGGFILEKTLPLNQVSSILIAKRSQYGR